MQINLVNSRLKATAGAVLDYVAPQRCIYCDQPSYLPEALCGVCQDALCPNDDGCPHCALPHQSGALCPTCLTQPAPPVGITAAYVYDDAMAYFMQRWKYLGEQRLALTAAKVMLKAPISYKNIDFLLPTPLHWQRQLRRGFNQSADLLHALASLDRSIALPPAKNIRISRSRRTDSQAKATRRERLKNLRGAFTVYGDVRGCTVGIVDDVCTTGATGNAMASALLEAGATRVHLYCLARTPAP